MLKDVSDGFSISPRFLFFFPSLLVDGGAKKRRKLEAERAGEKKERAKDVEQSGKIREILLFWQIIGLAPNKSKLNITRDDENRSEFRESSRRSRAFLLH